MFKRILGTLSVLLIAGLSVLCVILVLAQMSWGANPLREQMDSARLPQDAWELSGGERDAIVGQLNDVFYADAETGLLKRIDTSDLSGWTVREPMRYYTYTGSVLVQYPRWYYAVCYDDVAYVVVKAEARDLPQGTAPVPDAKDCVWSWEIVQEMGYLGGWTTLNMAFDMHDNDLAVFNTSDYGLLYCNSGCIAMWENYEHADGKESSDFDLSANPNLLNNVVTSDATKSYPLA